MASYFDAFRAEPRVAPTVAWESTSDPCSDDESEAADFAAMRRKTKAISQTATERGCLPAEVAAAAARKAKKQASSTAFKNLETLAAAAGALANILSPQPEQPSANGKIWQALKSANLVPTVSEPVSVVAAASPSQMPQAVSEQHASVTSVSPPKSSAARRHSDAVKAARCPETFSIFAEEEQAPCTAAMRESSLVRGYDALGAQHFTLDDSADTHAPSRASSITCGYDALGGGASTASLASSASSEGKKSSVLAPVRPPSRGHPPRSVRALRAAQAMPVEKAAAGASSAMELDVGLSRAATPTLQKSRPESPSLYQVTRAGSKHSISAGTRLPKLPVAGGKKGRDSLSALKSKVGSAASSTLWDVPPLRHSMDWNTRTVAF